MVGDILQGFEYVGSEIVAVADADSAIEADADSEVEADADSVVEAVNVDDVEADIVKVEVHCVD